MKKEEVVEKVKEANEFQIKAIEPIVRGKTAVTKEIEILMKGNLAFWANDCSKECLYGYVAGKIDQYFYMEEDKFEAVYELSWPITDVISEWFDKNFEYPEVDGDVEFGEVSAEFETDNFSIRVWLYDGCNDFSAYIERKQND